MPTFANARQKRRSQNRKHSADAGTPLPTDRNAAQKAKVLRRAASRRSTKLRIKNEELQAQMWKEKNAKNATPPAPREAAGKVKAA